MSRMSKPARIGLYSIGLKAYWSQFPGLRERLLGYGGFIRDKLSENNRVHYFGMVEDEFTGLAAGEFFAEKNVDIVFLHAATYCTSASVMPVHQVCGAPVVVLNLQPAAAMNYAATGTAEWLANCVACVVPEIVNALERCGIEARTVSGLLGMDKEKSSPGAAADENTADRPEAQAAWREIMDYASAASVKRSLLGARFGFLGDNYSGMLDLYSDFTLLQKSFRIHVEVLEMCTLADLVDTVTEEEIGEKLKTIRDFFVIGGGSASDPLAGAPDEESLRWSARVAVAQEKLTDAYQLDALSYYYHGASDNLYERIGAGLIMGNSLLTALGIPCAGEADIKTSVSMKICDLLGTGGSFCEIVAADYNHGTILMGHDGPFHVGIAADKPFLRGMKLYHGKRGSGISVEAKVRPGPITLLGVTQNAGGRIKCIISEGMAVDEEILAIGNTQTHVKFRLPIDDYYGRWLREAPIHHFAMSVGHNSGVFKKVAELLGLDWVEI